MIRRSMHSIRDGRRGGLLTRTRNVLAVMSLFAFVAGSVAIVIGSGNSAQAGGGTAKPPAPKGGSPFPPTPNLPNPVFTSPGVSGLHGFDVVGFIQAATVSTSDAACPGVPAVHWGGTVTVNDSKIVVPCNMIIQAPANTFRWADFIDNRPSLAVPDGHPSFELNIVGNTVGARSIAALMFASQQSLNVQVGYISSIDYATGNLKVNTGDPANPVTVQINDPQGRFGRAQSPDERFSVDDQNPTITSKTGYPMCVPRTDPATNDDALCPQNNRPKSSVATPCRNFSAAGIALPASGELAPAPAGDYCKAYVMNSVLARAAGEPDPRQQVPFEVGDHISFSGTLFKDASNGDYVSAHTIEADDVGVFTQPGTQPAYIAMGAFDASTADPNATAVNGADQESKPRMSLEAATTDVTTPVDIYMMDINPTSGAITRRWITPYEMTGEKPPPALPTGGITTQFAGPQPQRIRIRLALAPVGILSQPTRDLQVVQRSLCSPQQQSDQPLLDKCLADAAAAAAANPVANGLTPGQYFAPDFAIGFPENTKPGQPIIPNDLWHLGFLVNGEGPSPVAPSGGPLTPSPW